MTLENSLREAALVADRAGGFSIEVLQSGIRIRLTRECPHGEFNPFPRHITFEDFTGWREITEARQNPLVQSLRDLHSQFVDFKS